MQQVVHHPQSAAEGAVQAGQRVERAGQENLMAVRVRQVKQKRAATAGDGTGGGLREPGQLIRSG
jgi:hypothetical protein